MGTDDTDEGDALGQMGAPQADLDASVLDASMARRDGGADAQVDAGPPNAIKLKDETGAEVAEIVASGRGCPRGSWSAEMAPDGMSYTASFTQLNVTIDDATASSNAMCTLSIYPPVTGPLQYSAKTMSFVGQTSLEEGVVGAVELRHYYSGIRPNTAPGHAFKLGPYEGGISLTREVATDEARWTPCGAQRRGVNVDLLLRLTNGVPRNGGSVRSDVPDSKLSITLMSRRCPGSSSSR